MVEVDELFAKEIGKCFVGEIDQWLTIEIGEREMVSAGSI